MSQRPTGRWFAVLSMVAALAGGQVARAVPYASGITTNAGTVSFVLNENADDVKVIFDGGGTGNTNELGALAKGTHSFALGAHTSYEIHVTKSSAPTWTQISDDLNPLVRFYGPRGLAVFNNPADLSRFGRIYVSDSVGGLTSAAPAASNRTTEKGIYMLKADQSDALGYGNTAQNGGLFFGGHANSPFKIEVGEDNYLYLGDFYVDTGTIYRTDADLSVGSGVTVLEGAGQANPFVHTTANGSPIAKGSLEAGTLKLWCIDGRWGGTLGNNALLRWDITDTLLPHNMAPTELARATVSSVADVQSDLDIAPDGKFFVGQNRAAGTPNVYNTSQVNLRVYDTDGVTQLFDSLQASIDIGNGTDVLVNLRALKVSPDGKKLAVIRNDTQTMIVALTNGIPDLSQRTLVNTFGGTSTSTANGREVTWDAAGNLYAANITHEKLRIWSPGGSFTAITRSSGQFELTSPPTVLTLAAAASTVSEAGPLDAVFTVTRSGDVSSALTVNYALSGTAVNGVDYAALPGSITFLAGQTSTNITVEVIDDAEAEAVETIILTLGAGTGYSIGSGAVTVALLDNELPQLTIAAVQPKLLEGFAGSKATFRLTRQGDTNAAVTAGISYSGAAILGTDFNGPASVSIAAGSATATFVLTPVADTLVEGEEGVTVSVAANAAYTLGTAGSATATIVDDDLTSGTVLFAETFDLYDTIFSWTITYGSYDAYAESGYDYSAHGIPEAPNSTGTYQPTRGLKMDVNRYAQADCGLSMSPVNASFTGDYRLRFDAWINFNGPLSGGGPGSSEFLTAGLGATGTELVWSQGTATEGVWFAVDGDGGFVDTGLPGDFQAWTGSNLLLADSGAYAGGTAADVRGNFHPYYALWGGMAAPAQQVTDYPSAQTGTTDAGTLGMAWHSFVITRQGTNVTWDVDGLRIATVDISGLTLSTNILLGYGDQFQSTGNGDQALRFAIVDNVKVETLPPPPAAAPEIAFIQLINNGTQVQIDFSGSVGELASAFKLQAATDVVGNFADVTATITAQGGNKFRAVLAVNGVSQFYRVRR